MALPPILKRHVILIVFSALACNADSQSFFEPSDTFDRKRFWTVTATGAGIYAGFSYGLYNTWYKDNDIGSFHFFNDWNEWQLMDKYGHMFTAYNYSSWIYQGARWTGLKPRASLWTAAGVSTLLQTTIEVMDGFAEKWGFSWTDMAANSIGTGLFVGQELLWREQRITMKVSSDRNMYPESLVFAEDGVTSTTLRARANRLFGTSFAETFLKDYNEQTIWVSANIKSFFPDAGRKFPGWLNISFGLGAENMFEGFGYSWEESIDGGELVRFNRSPEEFPRYRQYYLSVDVDFRRIPTRSHFLKTIFSVINFVKIPAPAIEFTSQGAVKCHLLHW